MRTLADATTTASAISVRTDGSSRDPADVAGAGAAGALTGAATVAALGTAPPTRHSVATCGGGLASRTALCAGRLNTTGGPAAGGAMAAGRGAAGVLGAVVIAEIPGGSTCGCGGESGCFCWFCGSAGCVALGDDGLVGVICIRAVAGVPGVGSPSRPVCVATIVCAPAAAEGTVKLNATAPPRSAAPDHSVDAVDRSRCSCTALPYGLNPPPEPLTVAPLAAVALSNAMCAWTGAAITVTATIAAAMQPTAAAASRTRVDRQGYNKEQPRPGAGVSPILWGRSVLVWTGECKSKRDAVARVVRCTAWRARNGGRQRR